MPSPEIEALVRRLFAVRATGDSDAVANLFADSEHFLAIGNEEGEIWHGARARGLVADNWGRLAEESDEVVQVAAFESGSVGWAAVEGRRTRPELPPYGYHFTVVLTLERGAWQVVAVHFSVLVTSDQVNRVDLTPGLSGLLDSLDGATVSTGGPSRTGTVMFTDIVDSTAISEALGDQRWAAAIKGHLKTLTGVVVDGGGRVVKTLGDGAMFLFPSGGSALDAAIEIQRKLVDRSDGIRARIGIHTGDLMEQDDDLLGITVHKAARVASAAGADQILASETTAGLVNRKVYPFEEPMTVELKGVEGDHLLYPLAWETMSWIETPSEDV